MNHEKIRCFHEENCSAEHPYSSITRRIIVRHFSKVLIWTGVKNPKAITASSFILTLAASNLIFMNGFENWLYVIIISVLIVISPLLGSSSSQIAQSLHKQSLYGAWLDKYLRKIGDMVLYTMIGYQSWLYFDRFIYFILGICVGYLLSYIFITSTLKKSVFLSEIKKDGYETHGINPRRSQERAGKQHGAISAAAHGGRVAKFLGRVLFGVKISMDVWYLLTVVFILLRRTDIVLIFLSALFVVRSFAVTIYTVREIKVNEIGVN